MCHSYNVSRFERNVHARKEPVRFVPPSNGMVNLLFHFIDSVSKQKVTDFKIILRYTRYPNMLARNLIHGLATSMAPLIADSESVVGVQFRNWSSTA